MRKLLFAFQFLPIAAFLAVARYKGSTPDAWVAGFQVGAVLAVVESVVLALNHVPWNRLLLGANLYLVVGGFGCTFGIEPIIRFVSQWRESAVFLSLIVVGIVTTLFTPGGFIEAPHAERSAVVKNSALLLAAVCVCLALSIFFRGDPWLAGTIPFVLLVAIRRWRLNKLEPIKSELNSN